MLSLRAVLLAALAGGLSGQEPQDHPKQPAVPPVHAPHPVLPPAAALAFVRDGNARCAAARANGSTPAELPPRPSGAGRFVVGVVTCADGALDVPALLGLRSEDVLVVSNAGATVDGDCVELLERAVARERLSLVIVLTHADCASLQGAPAGDDRGARRGAAAREFAARRGLALDKAQAMLQRELLLGASTLLADGNRNGTLAVVTASANVRTGALTWHLSRADSLPIAPVR